MLTLDCPCNVGSPNRSCESGTGTKTLSAISQCSLGRTERVSLRRTGTNRKRSDMPGQASQLGRRGRESSVPGGEGGVGGIGVRNPRVAPSLRLIRVRDDDDDDDDDDVFQFQQTLRRMPDSQGGPGSDAPEPLIITCCNRRGGCVKTTNSTALRGTACPSAAAPCLSLSVDMMCCLSTWTPRLTRHNLCLPRNLKTT